MNAAVDRDVTFVMDAAQFIVEPPDLWSSRVSAKHRELAPKVVSLPGKGDAWAFEGGAWLRPLGLEAVAGQGPLEIQDQGLGYADIRRGAYEPKERLRDMAVDEVDMASIFPSFGMSVRNIQDPDLHLACVQAYNDGLWEWCQSGDARRLVPQALIPATGVTVAIAELDRVAKKGYKGMVFLGYPGQGMDPQAEEDPFWARCEEAGMVVNLVRGGPVGPDRTPMVPRRWVGESAGNVRIVDTPLEVMWAQAASINNVILSGFILTGILDRFPRMQLALIDAGAGWLPNCGELLDWNFRYSRYIKFAKLKHMPSDYIRRQVKATVKGERSTIENRHDVGVGALMWASHFPNSTTSWPTSPLVIEGQFHDVPEDERRFMLGENCAGLYRVMPVTSRR